MPEGTPPTRPSAETPSAADAAAYVALSRRRYVRKKRAVVLARAFGLCCLAAIFPFTPGNRSVGTIILAISLPFILLYVCQEFRRIGRQKHVIASREDGGRERAEPARVMTKEERTLQKRLRDAALTLDRSYRRWHATLLITALAAAGSVLALIPWLDAQSWWAAAVICVLGGAVMRVHRIRGDRAAREMSKSVASAGPQAAGALIDFFNSSDPLRYPPAFVGLSRVVRQMRASDGALLTPAHRHYLYRFLTPEQRQAQPEMALAAVHLAEQLADRDAETYLHEILAMEDPETAVEKALVKGAYRALQSIGQTGSALGKRGTLLSPASAPDELPQTLLRPATASAKENPEELLRPAGSGE